MDRFKVGYHTGDAQALRNRYVSAYGPDQEVILWAMFETSAPLVIETVVHTALKRWHCGGELSLEGCLPTLVVNADALCQSSVTSNQTSAKQMSAVICAYIPKVDYRHAVVGLNQSMLIIQNMLACSLYGWQHFTCYPFLECLGCW